MGQFANDADYDSLTYEFGEPLIDDSTVLNPYVAGYSYLSPLPDSSSNPSNQAATMDPENGIISFSSYTIGAFFTCTKVSSYRNGLLNAEIFREFQFVITGNGGSNLPPILTAPFPNNSNQFLDTVYVGDSVRLSLSATDFQLLPNGMPQEIELEAFGDHFGSFLPPSVIGWQPTFDHTQGCLYPPCAILVPAPGPNYPLSAQFGIQTSFEWLTDCAHLVAQNGINEYSFIIKATDDYCPIPGISYSTIKLVVVGKPFNNPPDNLSYGYIGSIQKVILQWSKSNVDSSNFIAYNIYESSSVNGPFVLIDSVMDYNLTLLDLVNSNVLNQNSYYQIRTKYDHDCDGVTETAPSETLAILVSNVEDLESQGLIISSAFPNPTEGISTLTITSNKMQRATLKIMNLGGKLLKEQQFNLNPGEQEISFSIANYPAGAYFYQIEVEDGVYNGKIVLQ
jgi:hypothetical protein